MPKAVRQVRLHLEERGGRLRKTVKLIFGRDGSVYLVPYARGGEFFYGGRAFAPGQKEDPFNFREQVEAQSQPKLSIHASGAVHIYANDQPKAGPLQIPPLEDFRGEHIASVRFDAVSLVPEMTGRTSITGPVVDYAVGVPSGVESGVLILYANGLANAFKASPLQLAFQVERPDASPIFIGLQAVAEERLGDDESGGVTVLAGFDPTLGPDDSAQYLYLRGL